MDKYEISLWEDYPDLTSNDIPFLNERKICVIGSNTMTSAARAMEPKLVSNVNGTNTFSFKIYYRYKDEITGEENINPYLPYIINEHKVKVLWKDKWYDLVIKKIEEDTQKRSVLCVCEDLFISELSKNGYELEFNSELQNNSGTAEELVEKVLDGSGWQPSENQQTIFQYQEESVYDVISKKSFVATRQPSEQQISIPVNSRCLIYYSCINKDYTDIQLYYAPNTQNGYDREKNSMLVTGGNCYTVHCSIEIDDDKDSNNFGQVIIKQNYNIIFNFNINNSTNNIEKLSNEYRAKRIVKSQLTAFDNLLGRYVNVYTYKDENNNDKEVYGYETTEFSDPALVVNLIVNSKDFKDTQGWVGQNLKWEVYPSFTSDNDQTITDYINEAKSYLKISNGYTYNTAFISNKQYLVPNQTDIKNGKLGGFQVGEKYIFRYKAKSSLTSSSYITKGINCWIYNFSINSQGIYHPLGSSYFSNSAPITKDGWTEITLTCTKACTANNLNSVGLFIYSSSVCYIEDIQFFKLTEGIDPETGETKRINPGEFLLPTSKVIYKYYLADHSFKDGNGETHIVEDPKDLVLLYFGETKTNAYTPKYNNYEKVTSIEVSKSNRFNILQTIAEKFECWIRFIINHNEETGQILYDENGLPQKYVQLVEQIGNDTGISFEYGIDLKGVKRTIVSNTIATKAIIVPNENEFGKNGFCTIARSPLNYCRENFILNFDYYIQQGLLNKDLLEADLYKTNEPNLGYYFWLNKFNREYDELVDTVNMLQIRLTKQQAEYTVQFGNLRASTEKLEDNKSDLMILAGVDNFEDAESYALAHKDNRKVQSLIGSIAKLNNTVNTLVNTTNSLESSINALKSNIQTRSDTMASLIQDITDLHKNFFKKYSRFIQEGTWQDQNYVDDDKYYLDALEVAYRSSRPQIQYDISLLRLSSLEDFSSKIFDLGDICYIQDKEFFGYEEDGVTPYKQKIIISQLTSFFDTPEKDVIKVQNYATQFDDLFQRITTAAQALQFSQGRYERAAEVVKPDGTLSFGLLQDTFDYNKDLVINSANQEVTWDNTGITVSDTVNSALKVKIMAGGIFASNDGGITWKNALRGDGISTDLLTAGRINTSEIYVYDGNSPSFRWDSQGINAYTVNSTVDPNTGLTSREFDFSKFVRFDKFGLYGYDGVEDFEPFTEDAIWYTENPTTHQLEPNFDVRFGLTWRGFFLRNASGNSSIEISTDNDILIKTGDTERIQIGKYNINNTPDYGMRICDASGGEVFRVSTTNNTNSLGGWTLTKNSFYKTITKNNVASTIGLYSDPSENTINGNRDKYYILAGDNFGVTIDGGVYASKGKIGDCEIVDGKLTIGSGNTKKNLIDAISTSYSETQYYLSNSENELSSGGSWSSSLPDQADNKYVWTRTAIITTTASGTTSTTYKPSEGGAYSQSLTEMLQGAKASIAVYRTQTIFRSIRSNESLPTKGPATWVNETAETITDPNDSNSTISSGPQGKWTQIRPVYNSEYPALYIATQTQTIKQYEDRATGTEGECSCTQPHLEVTTTVIDGAHITTGKIDAQRINVSDLSAFGATIGGFTIGSSAIYTTTKNDISSKIDGVYIGTNGISLGANFKVTSDGDLYANSGTFAGNVYASNILHGEVQTSSGKINYGTLPGSAISPNTIGTSILTTGVNTSLDYANSFNEATTNNGSYPDYFRAGALVGVNSISCGGSITGLLRGTSIKITSSDSDGTDIELATHSHTISFKEKDDGEIELTIGSPSNDLTNKASFNIADTAYYQAQVSAKEKAVGIEKIYIDKNTLGYTSHNSVDNPDTHLSYTIPTSDYSTKTAYSTTAKTLYGVFDLKLSNGNKYFMKIGIPTNNVFDAAVEKPTVTRVYPDPDKDYRTSGGQYWIYARGSVKINGTAKDGDNAELEVTDIYNVGVSYATPTSITRRINLANNQPMPDTWNNNTSKGYIYVTAKNSAGTSLLDDTIEVTTSSAIYQAGVSAGISVGVSYATPTSITRRINLANNQPMPDTWNNNTSKGYIYVRAQNSDGEIYKDDTIEVTTSSAIYQAGVSAGIASVPTPAYDITNKSITVTMFDDDYQTAYLKATGTVDQKKNLEITDSLDVSDIFQNGYDYGYGSSDERWWTVSLTAYCEIDGNPVSWKEDVSFYTAWYKGYEAGKADASGPQPGTEGNTQQAYLNGITAGKAKTYGSNFERAYNVALAAAQEAGYTNAYTMAERFQAGYIEGYNQATNPAYGDTEQAYNMGYAAGQAKTFGSDFERAYNVALGAAQDAGYTNAYAMAEQYQKGYIAGYMGQ